MCERVLGFEPRGCVRIRQSACPSLPVQAELSCSAAICSRVCGCRGLGVCTGVRYTRCLHALVCLLTRNVGPVGGMCPARGVGAVGCRQAGGARSPRLGCQILPVPQRMCPNQLHKPLGVGWDLLDKSLTPKQEGPTHPLASRVPPRHWPQLGPPAACEEGAKAFPG